MPRLVLLVLLLVLSMLMVILMASGRIRHRAMLVDKRRMGQTLWTKLRPVAELFLY